MDGELHELDQIRPRQEVCTFSSSLTLVIGVRTSAFAFSRVLTFNFQLSSLNKVNMHAPGGEARGSLNICFDVAAASSEGR